MNHSHQIRVRGPVQGIRVEFEMMVGSGCVWDEVGIMIGAWVWVAGRVRGRASCPIQRVSTTDPRDLESPGYVRVRMIKVRVKVKGAVNGFD